MDRPRLALLLACLLVAAVTGVAGAAERARPEPTPVTHLSPTQRLIADELVSVFENDTTSIRYDYVANLHDGCGFTAGRAGFCSATGDMLLVVRGYTARRPHNALRRYLPVLRARARTGSASVRGLGTPFRTAWKRAAHHDARFRAAQDRVVDALYFDPAARLARDAGLTSPLAVAIFYDTAIEHGTSHDPDGLPALIARTRARAGSPAAAGEARWLAAFLAVRRADLLHPHNRARQVDWPESVGRVDALAHLLAGGHLDLQPPLAVNPWGDRTFILQ